MFERMVLATRNQDKLREIRKLLSGSEIEILNVDDFPGAPEVVEDGETLAANAIKKAAAISAYTGLPAVADDTGLEVDCLGGAPGVFSARYAGENATYEENVDKLLKDMEDVAQEQRTATFRTVVALVSENEEELVAGSCHGFILTEPKGRGKFGYDPVFYLPEYELTFAEMDLSLKNKISHRGQAFQKFRELLATKQGITA